MTPPHDGHDTMHRSDDPASFALAIVRDEMGRRFDGLDKRLDQMVTRDALDATVRRLDAADAQLRRDLEDHEQSAGQRITNVELSVATGDRAILNRLDEEHVERRKSRRWAIGAVIATGGLAVSATALLVNVLA